MNEAQTDVELSIYDAVENLGRDELHQRVQTNAQQAGYDITDEHMEVIDSLVAHYKADCQNRDCHKSHEHMRFLEDKFSDKGGSRYLYELFHDDEGPDGVLHAIHKLADLPGLRLDVDKGFGTAF